MGLSPGLSAVLNPFVQFLRPLPKIALIPLAVVWLGRDDNGKTPLTGATGALQVWTGFMAKADPLPLDMPMRDNVVLAWIDPRTGQGSDPGCPGAVQMPYIRGSEPAPGNPCGIAAPAGVVMDWVKGWLE